jgi:hypothetical protein
MTLLATAESFVGGSEALKLKFQSRANNKWYLGVHVQLQVGLCYQIELKEVFEGKGNGVWKFGGDCFNTEYNPGLLNWTPSREVAKRLESDLFFRSRQKDSLWIPISPENLISVEASPCYDDMKIAPQVHNLREWRKYNDNDMNMMAPPRVHNLREWRINNDRMTPLVHNFSQN